MEAGKDRLCLCLLLFIACAMSMALAGIGKAPRHPHRPLGATAQIDVDMNRVQLLPKALWGIFFEEINHAGDGGLYAELIQNRGFDAHQVPDTSKKWISLSSYRSGVIPPALGSNYLGHCAGRVFASPAGGPGTRYVAEMNSTFAMIAGLANGTNSDAIVSFESINMPGFFLADNLGVLALQQNNQTSEFAQAATFEIVPGLPDDSSPFLSLRAYANPQNYIYSSGTLVTTPCGISQASQLLVGPVAFRDAPKATFALETGNVVFPWKLLKEGTGDGALSIDTSNPLNSVSQQAAMVVSRNSLGFGDAVGITNWGYWGINAQANQTYTLSLFAAADSLFASAGGMLLVTLEAQDGASIYAKWVFTVTSTAWTRYTGTAEAINAMDSNARLCIRLVGKGVVWLDVVSLFPPTWNNRPNGVRPDLAAQLNALQPSFVRFPGGKSILGVDVADGYNWKQTIGPIETRPGHYDLWGYWNDDGLGMFEFLVLIEDLKALPIFVNFIGISLSGSVPLNQLGPYINDTLDFLEFALGPVTSKWGGVRAQLGHPRPFAVEALALGDENCGAAGNYTSYYQAFASAISQRYPSMLLIANCRFNSRWVDAVDVHIYQPPSWFINNTGYFNKWSSGNPKAFLSEYQSQGNGTLLDAVAEAAFMTGILHNAEVMAFASYAPLFVNVNDRSWNPDMIQFNSSAIAVIPSYYVQQLFSAYRGDTTVGANVTAGTNLAVAATYATYSNNLNIFVVNYGAQLMGGNINLVNAWNVAPTGSVAVLTSASPADTNTLDNPNKVQPVYKSVSGIAPQFGFYFPPYSVTVLELSVVTE